MKLPRKQKDKKHLVKMGVAWYRPEQWERLRQVSDDVNEMEKTYEEWLNSATQKVAELEAQGIPVEKVEVDVNELLTYCNTQGILVNAKSRARFVADKVRKQD